MAQLTLPLHNISDYKEKQPNLLQRIIIRFGSRLLLSGFLCLEKSMLRFMPLVHVLRAEIHLASGTVKLFRRGCAALNV